MTHGAWPQKGLEAVAACPLCGTPERVLLHAGLSDRVFGVAPGTWSLWQCAGCRSAYLDPRPTPATIGTAYAGYYTHSPEDHPVIRRKGRIRSWLHDLYNGYQNARYGLDRQPSLASGRWLLPLVPSLRAAADAECRHLPRGGGRLLDVGCGNGGFLWLARQAGWECRGLDFDEGAIAACRARGLDAQVGSVETLAPDEGCYDVITMSHVIEHVHDPVTTLAAVHRLLVPGGMLWLDTPNLDSLGHARFGPAWRDLDPPRHLMLFSQGSLERSLRQTGFQGLRQRWRGMSTFDVYATSEAIEQGRDTSSASYGGAPPVSAVLAELREMLQPKRREFLTYLAFK